MPVRDNKWVSECRIEEGESVGQDMDREIIEVNNIVRWDAEEGCRVYYERTGDREY